MDRARDTSQEEWGGGPFTVSVVPFPIRMMMMFVMMLSVLWRIMPGDDPFPDCLRERARRR